MADPTPAELQSQIDDLKALITTEYQPPSGDEYSYPVVGQPLSDEQWQYVTRGLGDGVLDEGNGAYWLRNNGTVSNTNSTNTMILTAAESGATAQGLLRGFYHRLLQDKTLSFPGVTAKTTYSVVLKYDPLGHNSPTGPITAEVVTQLDYTLGKFYVVLWQVEREPNQLLTDAKITRLRPRVCPNIYVWDLAHRPPADKVLWGTICYVGSTGEMYRSTSPSNDGLDTGDRQWVKHKDRDLQDLEPDVSIRGDGSGYEYAGSGASLKSTRFGELIVMEGRVQRENGSMFYASNSSGYYIRTLPEAHRPSTERRFITKGPGTNSVIKSATIVISADGEVRAYPHADNSWVGVDGCVFTRGN